MTRWATVNREKLLKLRNEKSAEFRVLVDEDTGEVKEARWDHILRSASLLGCIEALDAVLASTKPEEKP